MFMPKRWFRNIIEEYEAEINELRRQIDSTDRMLEELIKRNNENEELIEGIIHWKYQYATCRCGALVKKEKATKINCVTLKYNGETISKATTSNTAYICAHCERNAGTDNQETSGNFKSVRTKVGKVRRAR